MGCRGGEQQKEQQEEQQEEEQEVGRRKGRRQAEAVIRREGFRLPPAGYERCGQTGGLNVLRVVLSQLPQP